jgi:hypothetical protein
MSTHRRGYTLVELLMVITMTTFVLATVGVMLHGVFRLRQTMVDQSQFVDHLSRLAEQFRNDAHAAEAVKVLGPDLTVTMRGGKRIQYQIDTDGVSRTVYHNDEVMQRDSHFLPLEFQGTWKVDESPSGSKPMAGLQIAVVERDTPEQTHDRRIFVIEAVVGSSPAKVQVANSK